MRRQHRQPMRGAEDVDDRGAATPLGLAPGFAVGIRAVEIVECGAQAGPPVAERIDAEPALGQARLDGDVQARARQRAAPRIGGRAGRDSRRCGPAPAASAARPATCVCSRPRCGQRRLGSGPVDSQWRTSSRRRITAARAPPPRRRPRRCRGCAAAPDTARPRCRRRRARRRGAGGRCRARRGPRRRRRRGRRRSKCSSTVTSAAGLARGALDGGAVERLERVHVEHPRRDAGGAQRVVRGQRRLHAAAGGEDRHVVAVAQRHRSRRRGTARRSRRSARRKPRRMYTGPSIAAAARTALRLSFGSAGESSGQAGNRAQQRDVLDARGASRPTARPRGRRTAR